VLALEGVGDPGNVGTAMRAAHAVGASLVVLGDACCDWLNPKAVRASAGGIFSVPARRASDLAGLLARLRSEGARVVAAAAAGGREPWSLDLTGPTAVVVGSEARGLSAGVMAAADGCVSFPMPGGAESLNAGMAAGLLLYEALRQRRGAGGRPRAKRGS
jgi:TrmH family RNA methyltransferase